MYIIVIPYRAKNEQEFRRNQLIDAIDNYREYFLKHNIPIKIVVCEQNNLVLFNRGLLLNAGFIESERTFDFSKKYFHMNVDYRMNMHHDFPNEINEIKEGFVELFRVEVEQVIASACIFDSDSYKKCNGFPNDISGWGGDDWALLHRARQANVPIISNYRNKGVVYEEIVKFYNDGSFNENNINLAINRDDTYTNGVNTSEYRIDGVGEFHNGTDLFHFLFSI